MAISDLLKSSKVTPTGGSKKSSPVKGISALMTASNASGKGPAYVTPPPQEEKKTLGDKVKSVGKEIVKGIVSPVVTTVARPFQAAAELAGVSDEKVNSVSKKISGGYIAPTPQNTSDVVKDVGRAIQTVLLGAGGSALKGASLAKTVATEGAIGAGFGASAALEQGGTDTTAKDILKSSAIGGTVGALAPVALKGISKLLNLSKVAPAVEDVSTKVDGVVAPKVEPTTPKVNIPESPAQLPERTQTSSTQGDNFTFTDKADPQKVATTKAQTIYDAKLKDYNQNPTPNKLKGVLKAKENIAKAETTPVYNTNIPESKVSTSPSVVKMPNPNKGETISKASRDINKKLVDDGFNKLEPSEQAKFTSESRTKQVEDITTYMSDDIDNAVASAVSGKGIPKEIDEQILFNAIKNHASEIGDVDLQRALAKSPIASKRSILAQELGASATLNDPSDAVSIMSNLNKNLEKTIEKKLGKPIDEARKEVLESIKKEVRKINPKQSFQDFINRNIC